MDLTMPRLSDTMEEGTVARWIKKEGDAIQKGDVIAEIQTDKANMEMEAFDAGVLERIIVPEGRTVPVGDPIAVLNTGHTASARNSASPAPAAEAETPPIESAAPPEAPAPAQADTAQPAPEQSAAGGRVKASPLARRLAQERGLDLSSIRGTGPHGRITRADIEKAPAQTQPQPAAAPPAPQTAPRPAAAPAAPAGGPVAPFSRVQGIIVDRMVQSKTTVPHFYVTTEIDMDGAVALRKQLNSLGDQQVSFNDMVVKACAQALRLYPKANVMYTEQGFRQNERVNIGVAVALEDALVVPVVKDVDKKGLFQIAAETRELAQKARENKLSADDLSGGTFTVSNLGMFGVDEFIAIINAPESAILAVGAITQKPVVKDGQIVIGHRMRVTLSADHRVLYGANAAEFLRELRQLLESPLKLGFA